jgi:internalin A
MKNDFELNIWEKLTNEWKDIFAINLVANVRLNDNLREKIFRLGQNPFECFKAYFGKKFKNNLSSEEILQLPNIKHLYLADLGINDFPLCSFLSLVESLDICLNQFEDITFLEGLPSLKSFYAEANKIHNIDALNYCSELQELNLRENGVVSIQALRGLVQLNYLDIGKNSIEDISAISSHIHLTELQLDFNQIKDCAAIAACKSLKILVISNNPIHNLTVLNSLDKIQHFDA